MVPTKTSQILLLQVHQLPPETNFVPRFARTSVVLLKQETIDNMRRQIEEGVEPRHENGGAPLRKLISVQGSGDNATKGLSNRMKFSDAEILPEVMG